MINFVGRLVVFELPEWHKFQTFTNTKPGVKSKIWSLLLLAYRWRINTDGPRNIVCLRLGPLMRIVYAAFLSLV